MPKYTQAPLVRKAPERPIRFKLPNGDQVEICRVSVAYKERRRRKWIRCSHAAAIVVIAAYVAADEKKTRIRRGVL